VVLPHWRPVLTSTESKWGLGLQNLKDMPLENIYNFGLLQYAGAPFYITSILGFKLSLLVSFYRIAIQRAHRIVIIAIMVAVCAFHFTFLVVQLNLCTPVCQTIAQILDYETYTIRFPSSGIRRLKVVPVLQLSPSIPAWHHLPSCSISLCTSESPDCLDEN
jgi:hypothetical protein